MGRPVDVLPARPRPGGARQIGEALAPACTASYLYTPSLRKPAWPRRPVLVLLLLALSFSTLACVGPPVGSASSGSGGRAGSRVDLPPPGLTRRVRRLSNHEYDNVVRDLLGDTTRPSRAFLISDAFPNGYDNGSDGLAVQSDQVLDYQTAAESRGGAPGGRRQPRLL